MTPSLLRRVVDTLDAAVIPHALIGAAALATHGISRSTLDQDLLTTDARALEAATWQAMGDADIRRGDASDPLTGVVRLTAPHERDVDVIVGRHAWQGVLVDEAETIETAEGRLRVSLLPADAQAAWATVRSDR